MRLVALFAIFNAFLPGAAVQKAHAWPVVRAFSHYWRIPDVGSTDQDTSVATFIYDVSGTPVYKLECHNGNYSGQSELNFSGTFQCALFAIEKGKNTSWNLLATKDERTSDWGNRGRMIAEQLQGKCGSWPEFGVQRTFKLRGMIINFTYRDLQWIDGDKGRRLGAFTFAVRVEPDEKATSSEAESINVPKPPKTCLW